MRRRLQVRRDGDETAFVGGEPARGRPRFRGRAGDQQRRVGREHAAVLELRRVALEAAHHAFDQAHALPQQRVLQQGAGARAVARQDRPGSRDQLHAHAVAAHGQAVLHRQRDLHAAGAGADDGQPQRHVGRQRVRVDAGPALDEVVERPDRQREVAGARDCVEVHRRARGDGKDVELDQFVAVGAHRPVLGVESHDPALHEDRAGGLGQRGQRNRQFRQRVVAGDPAGQHAAVHEPVRRRHEDHFDVPPPLGGERAQHEGMRLAASDEQQSLHRFTLTRRPATCRRTTPRPCSSCCRCRWRTRARPPSAVRRPLRAGTPP